MTAIATADPRAHQSQVAQVWDQLWTHQPTNARDDDLLARERASKRWRLMVEHIRNMFGRLDGLRTIELGSGRGDLSALLAREGAEVTLLDASDRALDQARARFDRLGLPAKFERGDLFKGSALQAGFDVALSSGVIEHFPGRQRTEAIRAHANAVREGGLTIISVPNAHCVPYRIWKAWLEWRQSWPYGFERPYPRRELLRRAREAGLLRVEVRGCGFRQSLSDQFLPLLSGRRTLKCMPDSLLDDRMGLSLVLFGWNR